MIDFVIRLSCSYEKTVDNTGDWVVLDDKTLDSLRRPPAYWLLFSGVHNTQNMDYYDDDAGACESYVSEALNTALHKFRYYKLVDKFPERQCIYPPPSGSVTLAEAVEEYKKYLNRIERGGKVNESIEESITFSIRDSLPNRTHIFYASVTYGEWTDFVYMCDEEERSQGISNVEYWANKERNRYGLYKPQNEIAAIYDILTGCLAFEIVDVFKAEGICKTAMEKIDTINSVESAEPSRNLAETDIKKLKTYQCDGFCREQHWHEEYMQKGKTYMIIAKNHKDRTGEEVSESTVGKAVRKYHQDHYGEQMPKGKPGPKKKQTVQ